MQEPETDETALWRRLRTVGDGHARDALYGLYAPWASSLANALFRQYKNPAIEREDYLQNAKIGLLEAISRYDPERGVPFAVYAQARVRGSVINGLRTVQDRLQPAVEEDGGPPGADDAEMFEQRDAFDVVVDSVVDASIGVLLGAAFRNAVDSGDGYAYARAQQIEARLRAAVEMLPERLRAIVVDHYYRQAPFHSIAARLRLTKGRVSQLHHEALRRIRANLREL